MGIVHVCKRVGTVRSQTRVPCGTSKLTCSFLNLKGERRGQERQLRHAAQVFYYLLDQRWLILDDFIALVLGAREELGKGKPLPSLRGINR
jgi:hypothetical protein